MGLSQTPQRRKVCSVEKCNCCLCNVKLPSRNDVFCLVIAFPPPLTQAKRSLLWLQPGNGRQALGCSWLSSYFCLCWTHGDAPLTRSKVLKAICFCLKAEKAVLSHQHAHWGRLPCWQSSRPSSCFSLGAVGPMAPTQISGASEKYKHKLSNLLPSSQLYCRFGNYSTQFSALLGPLGAAWTQRAAHTAQLARPVPQFVIARIINQFISFNEGLVSKLLLMRFSYSKSHFPVAFVWMWFLTTAVGAAARRGWFSWDTDSLVTPHNQ